MLLDIQIAKNAQGKLIHFELDVPMDNKLIEDRGYAFTSSCKLIGDMVYEFESLKIVAKASVSFKANCDMCGDDLTRTLDFDVNETFANSNSEDSNYYEIGSTSVDVMPMLVDNFFEYLPSRIVCKDDCKGLCDMCGRNLNYHSCNCEEIKQELDNQDNPFYKLKYIRGIDKDGSSKD